VPHLLEEVLERERHPLFAVRHGCRTALSGRPARPNVLDVDAYFSSKTDGTLRDSNNEGELESARLDRLGFPPTKLRRTALRRGSNGRCTRETGRHTRLGVRLSSALQEPKKHIYDEVGAKRVKESSSASIEVT